MPTQKCPIITLCKIANAIVFTPKKYPYAQNPMLIFSGFRSRIFSSHRTAHASLPRSPPPISAVQKKIKHRLICFSNVLHKVFTHFTTLHFGKLKQIYLHLFRSIPFTPYYITAQQTYFVPHTLAFFQRFR